MQQVPYNALIIFVIRTNQKALQYTVLLFNQYPLHCACQRAEMLCVFNISMSDGRNPELGNSTLSL